ncbi:heme o synthase [Macrococcoides caseolyticum]|uniref:Protoheme IX farnesyltransferase n=2 Tax=Macrococcoides caseolyticum TaxID=69966 RepID=COXX_MACCJ|nr:heme o synthase [Macrococcus caseolyticus]B9EB27.1 RecName: Full=Protoheme IX farnesyltransferase; AltName: Full=Heme B farnesyltransferase; AltName: Full=Heme O synthase [Macrococcus caseolyticus JCSC5402]MDJ1154338.1 heme o synthase [Macrococcus caseolyticus]MDJ1155610.1 heme o synthase [Macrococcus caseolyticus]PKE00046.1 protoheme IX farnesyltransferase [Macrococcus caseolyticus]PKE12628.1 protoheme IX farnesyltransferase [Macrococcus caseolyticus]PKE18164.1 protoheme IX farnesyltransf
MQNEHILKGVKSVERRLTFKDVKAIVKLGLVQGNLIPAFAGAFIAIMLSGRSFLSSIPELLTMLFGTTLIMAGSCALNNFYDQDIDSIMPSKQNRPSVTGKVSTASILQLSLVLMIVGEMLLFTINIETGIIGFLGIFGYVVLYSVWSKRHLVSNTIIGSFPGAIPPLVGYAAIEPSLSSTAWMLFVIMFIWQPAHFYALAIKRSEEYALAGIPMLPSVKGFKRTRLSMLFWVMLLLPTPFFMQELGTVFMVLASVLNLGWLLLAISGFRSNVKENKWAMTMFVYSLNYLMIFFVMIVVVTLIQTI